MVWSFIRAVDANPIGDFIIIGKGMGGASPADRLVDLVVPGRANRWRGPAKRSRPSPPISCRIGVADLDPIMPGAVARHGSRPETLGKGSEERKFVR